MAALIRAGLTCRVAAATAVAAWGASTAWAQEDPFPYPPDIEVSARGEVVTPLQRGGCWGPPPGSNHPATCGTVPPQHSTPRRKQTLDQVAGGWVTIRLPLAASAIAVGRFERPWRTAEMVGSDGRVWRFRASRRVARAAALTSLDVAYARGTIQYRLAVRTRSRERRRHPRA